MAGLPDRSVARDESITRVLRAVGRGDARAAADLLPLVYAELRKLADSWMVKLAPGQTLQPTALVHEAFLRLVRAEDAGWENRRRFFFAAARAMRDILVEQARRKVSLKRGGDRRRVDVNNLVLAIAAPAEDILVLNEALEQLERDDPRKHQIVMLRFFAGFTTQETADLLNISLRTVQRHWRYIRARLHKELAEPEQSTGRDDG